MDVLDQCQTVIIQLPSQSIVYEWLFRIHDFYRPIHTYVSIILCLFGTLCNFCNIVVLTRKQMRTPVNMILTAMACCDTVVLFSNLVYTTHYTFVAFANCHPKHWSYGWAMFLIAHAHLSLVGHSSSVWLSVMLAFIRYLTLRRRGKMTGVQIDLRHSYVAITAVIVFVSVMNAPNFLTYKIMEMGLNETCVITDESVRFAPAYVPGVSDMAVEADCLVFRMAFWISGTVFKVLPCIFLTLLVSLLTRILNEVKANRQRLLLRSSRIPTSALEISTTSNTVLSAGAATTAANINFNTVVPAPAQVQPPAIAFHSNSTGIISNSGGNRRHSSYDALPPPSPQLLTIFDRPKSGVIPAPPPPPSPMNHSLSRFAMAATVDKHLIKKGDEHSMLIRSNSAKATVNSSSNNIRAPGGHSGGGTRADRTTRMLLAIVCVFLMTEFPQGIMALLSGFFSEEFRRYIYNNVGDILDLLSLCEACTSFIIYCSMSGQFRNEFRRVFVPIRFRRWLAENSRYVNNVEQRSNCFPCSDTYANHSKSGGGAGGSADSTDAGTKSACTSPFLRPASSFSARYTNDSDHYVVANANATRRTPLNEHRERRSVTINLMDGANNPLRRSLIESHRSASPSLAILDESDDVCDSVFFDSKTPNENRGDSTPAMTNSQQLISPKSPDIPIIFCSDWSEGNANKFDDYFHSTLNDYSSNHKNNEREINPSNSSSLINVWEMETSSNPERINQTSEDTDQHDLYEKTSKNNITGDKGQEWQEEKVDGFDSDRNKRRNDSCVNPLIISHPADGGVGSDMHNNVPNNRAQVNGISKTAKSINCERVNSSPIYTASEKDIFNDLPVSHI